METGPTQHAALLAAVAAAGFSRQESRRDLTGRDRFILSEAQAGIGLYPVLAKAGFFPLDLLDNFTGPGSTMGVLAVALAVNV